MITKSSKRNLRKKSSKYAKKAKLEKQVNPIIEKEDNLPHNERVDIFYDSNKVSKKDILSDMYIRVLHIAELEV